MNTNTMSPQHTPGPLVPVPFASVKAPAALALREARAVARPLSINKRVSAYRGPIFHGVFS